MTTKATLIKDYPKGYDMDEILAHAIVAAIRFENERKSKRANMRSYVWAQLATSTKCHFGDEHCKLVERALHLEQGPSKQLWLQAAQLEGRTLWFYYLLAQGVAAVPNIAPNFPAIFRENMLHKLMEVAQQKHIPLLALLHYDCGLISQIGNNNRPNTSPEAWEAALYGLLNALTAHGADGCWQAPQRLVLPKGYQVHFGTSPAIDAEGNPGILVYVNSGAPVLILNLKGRELLWTAEDAEALYAHLQQS
ncbi:MAG: hypothetical protein WAX89_06630 [Alphaproteobacteria bacterium]